MELDEIIYNAIIADATLSEELKDRVKSTCIEVPPTEDDKTPLPYIVIAEESLQNDLTTKDDLWESDTDRVQVGVIISDVTPKKVKRLRRLVRKAVSSYAEAMGDDMPSLQALTADGIAWDWMKPCYYDTLHYQADMLSNLISDENE